MAQPRPPLLAGAPAMPPTPAIAEPVSSPARAALPEAPGTPDAPATVSASPGARTVALVSSPFAKRADAEAMLSRMREHVNKTLPPGSALEGEVFESPQGYRAALWPFGSREEAQIVNATMVARGLRTRAVDF